MLKQQVVLYGNILFRKDSDYLMEYVLYSTITGAFIMASFILGLHYGGKIARGEVIDKPKLNPIKAVKENIKESKLSKEEEKKQQELQDFIDAFENYDGSIK